MLPFIYPIFRPFRYTLTRTADFFNGIVFYPSGFGHISFGKKPTSFGSGIFIFFIRLIIYICFRITSQAFLRFKGVYRNNKKLRAVTYLLFCPIYT